MLDTNEIWTHIAQLLSLFSISMLLLKNNMSSHSRIWNPKYITNSPDSFASLEFRIHKIVLRIFIMISFSTGKRRKKYVFDQMEVCLLFQLLKLGKTRFVVWWFDPMSSLQSRIAAIISHILLLGMTVQRSMRLRPVWQP